MIAGAGQAILHATVAALVIEALLGLWRVEDPGERLALRWVAIGAPLLTAIFVVAVPWRASTAFVEEWSLFAGSHWNQLQLGGVGLASAAALALSVFGTALYLRDAVPFIADRLVRTAPEGALPVDHPAAARVTRVLAALSSRDAATPSAVAVIEAESPVLLCTGVDRTVIVISTGTLERLDDGALQAALAHEMAHLAAGDPLMGWWLLAARTLQFFNPVVQIVARQAVQDQERRADVAVTRQGHARELALAVHRLGLAADARSDLALPSEGPHIGGRMLASVHRRALDARCQLLLEGELPSPLPHPAWRIGLACAALTALLFLVV